MSEPATGIGTTLRRARMVRGKTIEEASRDTKIRPDAIRALEGGSFEALQGDVYVRGFLRSYSTYLGLDPEQLVARYASGAGELEPSPPPPAPPEADRASSPVLPGGRRGSWLLAAGIAAIVVLIAGAVGLFSGSRSVPPPVGIPTDIPTAIAGGPGLTLSLTAAREVQAVVTADGTQVFSGTLQTGEGRSFTATGEISVQLSRGGVVDVRVNGHDYGSPGVPTTGYSRTFTVPSPTPATSPGNSTLPGSGEGSPSPK